MVTDFKIARIMNIFFLFQAVIDESGQIHYDATEIQKREEGKVENIYSRRRLKNLIWKVRTSFSNIYFFFFFGRRR